MMMILKQLYSNKVWIVLVLFLLGCASVKFKKTYKGYSVQGAHSRALAADESGVFTGGSKGKISKLSYEGELIWSDSIPNSEDFRDVHVLGNGGALYLNSGDNGVIWQKNRVARKVFDSSGVFLDGFAFWDDFEGIAYGDPVDGKFFMIKTIDAGWSWEPINSDSIPYALPNEAGFAASGTGIQCVGASTVFIGTGACDTSRLYRSFDKGESWDVVNTPMQSGESFGIYAMYFWSEKEGIIIGGSYLEKEHKENICFYTGDSGLTWSDRSEGLAGYCSGIHGNKDASLIVATGRMGTFYTTDKGLNWNLLMEEAYYSVFVTETDVVFSGRDGIFESMSYELK